MKTGPPTTRVVFALGIEQGMFTTHAKVVAVGGMVTIFTAERCFGAGFTGDAVLLGVQLCLPVLFTPGDFIHSICHCNVSFGIQTQVEWI